MMRRSGRRVIGLVPSATAAAISAFIAACAAYLALLTAAAAWAARRRPAAAAAAVIADGPPTVFAVVVPAHDEEAVIGRTIEALRAIDYPPDRFHVHVAADNCHDRTATVARRLGATVHERTDPPRGKGPTLDWALDRIPTSDAVAVVDADTVVDPQFLAAMDGALRAGAVAAQGRYDVLGPGADAAGLRAVALASRHHVRPLGRSVLGGTCGLFGNGMAFRRDLLAGRRWTDHLVEDAEFQCELLVDGHRVVYVPAARVEAEMPTTLDAAVSQNERWELGRLRLVRRFVPTFLRLARRERQHRVARLDAAADLLVPPLSVLAAASALSASAGTLVAVLRPSPAARRLGVVGSASLAVLGAHVAASIALADLPPATYRSLAAAPRAVVWKVGVWCRVVVRPDDVEWVRTRRNQDRDGS